MTTPHVVIRRPEANRRESNYQSVMTGIGSASRVRLSPDGSSLPLVPAGRPGLAFGAETAFGAVTPFGTGSPRRASVTSLTPLPVR
jgi:hypothetical protein